MKRLLKYFIALVISILGIKLCVIIVKLVLIPIHFFFIDYNMDPYINNLSSKDSAFTKTANYFIKLIPSNYKYEYALLYKKNSRRKRTIILRAEDSDDESFIIKNVSYRSRDFDSFLNCIGIQKNQIDTLDTYMSNIKCNYIEWLNNSNGNPSVKMKMKESDIYSY